jgi:Fe-S oxidoreductase
LNRWYPEVFNEFKVVSVFDLLLEYIREGRIQLDKSVHTMPVAYHDPCNYGRKSLKAFGQAYFEEAREITRACADDFRELNPNRKSAYCCGAGGGAWAMPFSAERVYYGRLKARQIVESGAHLLVAPCHNCRDQILKSLIKEYDLGIEVKYIWELVADSLIMPNKQ